MYNISTLADNHSIMAKEGSHLLLIRLAQMKDLTVKTRRFAAMSICSLTMQDSVRSSMVRTGITQPMCELHSLLKKNSTDELTMKCTALALSNLARNAKSQATIVNRVDIVPLMEMASTMTRFDRTSLNIREISITPGSQEALEEEKKMNEETEPAYELVTIRSNMIDLNWSTHDFDPTRTIPPPPTLPSFTPHPKILVLPENKEDRRVALGQKGSRGEQHQDNAGKNLPSAPGSPSSPGSPAASIGTKGGDFNTKRYSEQPYVGGPCVVSNETLEELASNLFKRACVSMEELRAVDDVLQREHEHERDRLEELEEEREEEERKKGKSVSDSSTLSSFQPLNGLTNEFSIDDGDSIGDYNSLLDRPFQHVTASSLGSSLISNDLPPSTPMSPMSTMSSMSSMLSMSRETTATNSVHRSLVSSIAMRARKKHRQRRDQQYKKAKEFIAEMQDRAANQNLREFSQLRVSLLEQTYTWASADQKQQLMEKKGSWQGNSGGVISMDGTPQDLIELDTLPKMMVEGLKRTLSSRLATPVTEIPKTASTSRGSTRLGTAGSMGFVPNYGRLGTAPSRGGRHSRGGTAPSRSGTAGTVGSMQRLSTAGSRLGTAGSRLSTAGSMMESDDMMHARLGTPTIVEEEDDDERKTNRTTKKRRKKRKRRGTPKRKK